jgi:hypothetical protein
MRCGSTPRPSYILVAKGQPAAPRTASQDQGAEAPTGKGEPHGPRRGIGPSARSHVGKKGRGPGSRHASRLEALLWRGGCRCARRRCAASFVVLAPSAPRGSASLSQSQYNPGASCTSPMNAQWFGASEEDGRSLLHRLAQQAGQ